MLILKKSQKKIFLNPQDLKNRIKKSELNSFLNQYSILDTENRNSIFYYLLTNDSHWLNSNSREVQK